MKLFQQFLSMLALLAMSLLMLATAAADPLPGAIS
jgi:hypothetical protein